MNGRLLNDEKKDVFIEAKLKDMPEYVAEWNLNMKASRKTAATRKDYIQKIDKFLRAVNYNITETNTARYFLSAQTRKKNGELVYTSDSYQLTVWCCLNSFFDFMYRHNYVEKNYMQEISRPKNRDLARINEHRVRLNGEDFQKILTAIDDETNVVQHHRDRAMILLLMNTGMRRGALTNIMLDDIDYEAKTLTVIDKGNKRHQYFLDDLCISAIEEWLEVREAYIKKQTTEKHLFLSDHGNGMSEEAVSNVSRKYTKAALGKELSPHKLRSGYCSILYEKSGDIEFVRRAVGHANSATTQRYIVTKGDERKRAAEIMSSVLH